MISLNPRETFTSLFDHVSDVNDRQGLDKAASGHWGIFVTGAFQGKAG